MSTKNPFTPTFGRVPELLAGRRGIVEEMAEAFDNGPGDPNLSTIYTPAARARPRCSCISRASRLPMDGSR